MVLAVLLVVAVVWSLRALSNIGISLLDIDTLTFNIMALYISIIGSVTCTVSMIAMTNERINQRLVELAMKDPLTSALNRRAFYEMSQPILAQLSRVKSSLAICVIDIDHFKKINDKFGHSIGDQVLKTFTRLAHSKIRDGDLLARHGGEEFVVLLQNCDQIKAIQTIERITAVPLRNKKGLVFVRD